MEWFIRRWLTAKSITIPMFRLFITKLISPNLQTSSPGFTKYNSAILQNIIHHFYKLEKVCSAQKSTSREDAGFYGRFGQRKKSERSDFYCVIRLNRHSEQRTWSVTDISMHEAAGVRDAVLFRENEEVNRWIWDYICFICFRILFCIIAKFLIIIT